MQGNRCDDRKQIGVMQGNRCDDRKQNEGSLQSFPAKPSHIAIKQETKCDAKKPSVIIRNQVWL